MINYVLCIVAFFLGWFCHKKKEDIKSIYYSIKLFIKMSKKDDMEYNDFFEDKFHKSEIIKERNGDNV